jgi:cytochrome c biogenesis protein CcmG/thiol:disulfide interchange protein DsbE
MRGLGLLFAFACAFKTSAPALEMSDLDALHGRVVYLDFWASWCAPCRHSFPWMEGMKNQYEAKGLTIIAVNLDQERAAADTFLRRFHPGFEIRFDPQGLWAAQFGIQGMPTSILIDRHGVARFTHIGFRPNDGSTYERQIEQLLAEP